MYKLTPQQIAAITDELNQARCLEKQPVGNLELTRRLVKAIESSPESQPPSTRTDLEDMGLAIERALWLCPTTDILQVIHGFLVVLVTESLQRAGHAANGEITLDGGELRDITIHAEK